MTPFAIAGVQMHVTTHSNIDAMRHRLDLLMHLYPWVQMVMFSELACYRPAAAERPAAAGRRGGSIPGDGGAAPRLARQRLDV